MWETIDRLPTTLASAGSPGERQFLPLALLACLAGFSLGCSPAALLVPLMPLFLLSPAPPFANLPRLPDLAIRGWKFVAYDVEETIVRLAV